MRNWLINITISLVSLLFCFMVGEIAFRIVGNKGNALESWSDRPKFYYNPANSTDNTGQDHNKKKPADVFRIGVVGDSYSFAPFMQYHDSYAKRLETLLNIAAQNKNLKKVEVVNYGISGYSTNNEIDLVKRAIAEKCDLIILQVTLNDAEIKPFKPEGRIIKYNRFGAITSEVELGWLKYSKLGSFIYTRLDAFASRNSYKDYYLSLYEESNSVVDRKSGSRVTGFQLFKKAVQSMKRLTRKAQIPFVAVVFPLFGVELDKNYPFDPIHEKVGEFLRKGEIPHLDLKSLYMNIPTLRLQVIPGIDFHPNEIAHRMAGEELYMWLYREKLIGAEYLLKNVYEFRNHLEYNSEDKKFASEFLRN